MKKMKLVALCIALLQMLLLFAACGGDPTVTTGTSTTKTPTVGTTAKKTEPTTTVPSTTVPTTTEPATTLPSTTEPTTTVTTEVTTTLTPENVCALLNTLLPGESTTVTLQIATLIEGVTLNARFETAATGGSYSIERLNRLPAEFDPDADPESFLPEGFVSTETGSYTLPNTGKDIPSATVLRGQFRFDSTILADAEIADGSLLASVTNPKAFLGASIDATEMTVAVSYSDAGILEMLLSYSTEDATVTMTYTFE